MVIQSAVPIPVRTSGPELPGLLPGMLILVLLTALVPPGTAAVHTIGPGDSIQEAITSANPGDTIVLAPGVYNQHGILILKNITLRADTASGGSAADTIIDAGLQDRIFDNSVGYPGGYWLTIDNLTLRNGYSTIGGGAIYSTGGGTTTVRSSRFMNCSTSAAGGAIIVQFGSAEIAASSFSNCSAKGQGGAVYVNEYASAGKLRITSSAFSDCSGWLGGAVVVTYGEAVIRNVSFVRCRSADSGGAMYFGTGRGTLLSSTFANCTAGGSGGALYVFKSPVAITSSSFSNCSAPWYGGAVYLTYSPAVIRNSRFTDCSAGAGGALNDAGNEPGSVVDIASSLFANCSAKNGGAIFSGGVPDGRGTDFSINTTTFSRCRATTDSGGAISSRQNNLTINNSAFSGCTAPTGGGALYTYRGTARITSASFTGNSDALGRGGAVCSQYSDTRIRFSRLYQNTAVAVMKDGGTVDAAGNWWGTNQDPGHYTTGGVNVSPWLVLGITAKPLPITPARKALIRVNLTRRSDGTDTAGNGTFVPDRIPVGYRATAGGILPASGAMLRGSNETWFTPRATVPRPVVSATVDSQTVSLAVPVTIGTIRQSMAGVFRPAAPSRFFLRNGTGNTSIVFGSATDIPVTGDWNGDGFWDVGVFNGSARLFRLKNGSTTTSVAFGSGADVPVTGDWDGNGVWDVGVFRPSLGTFFLRNGTTIIPIRYGSPTDIPVTGKWR